MADLLPLDFVAGKLYALLNAAGDEFGRRIRRSVERYKTTKIHRSKIMTDEGYCVLLANCQKHKKSWNAWKKWTLSPMKKRSFECWLFDDVYLPMLRALSMDEELLVSLIYNHKNSKKLMKVAIWKEIVMKLNESKLFGELRINESEFFGEMRMKIRVWRSNIN